jgi:YHS domain-containing protein
VRKLGATTGTVQHADKQQQQLDPVCGRTISNQGTGETLTAEYKKRRYYFCSESCRCTFQKRAEKLRMNELAQAGSLFNPSRVRWGMA